MSNCRTNFRTIIKVTRWIKSIKCQNLENHSSIQYPSKMLSDELSRQKSFEGQNDQSNLESSNPSSYVNYNRHEDIADKDIESASCILNHPISCILNPSSWINYNHLEYLYGILYPKWIIVVLENVIPNKLWTIKVDFETWSLTYHHYVVPCQLQTKPWWSNTSCWMWKGVIILSLSRVERLYIQFKYNLKWAQVISQDPKKHIELFTIETTPCKLG